MENDPNVANRLLPASGEATSTARKNATNTNRKKRASFEEKKRESITKKLKGAQINVYAIELIKAKKGNLGRLPHMAMENAIAELAKAGVVTTRNVINKLIQALENEKEQRQPFGITFINTPNGEDGNSIVSSLTNSLRSTASSSDQSPQPAPTTAKKKKGRPSGTTDADRQRFETAKKSCIHEIARLYSEERKNQKEHGTRVSRGFLPNLIEAQKQHFSLPEDYNIPPQTIISRRQWR